MREEIDQKQIQVEENKKDPKFLKRQEHEISINLYQQYLDLVKQKHEQINKDKGRNDYQQNLINSESAEDIPQEEFEKLTPKMMKRNIMYLRTNLMLLMDKNDKLSVQRDYLNKQGQQKLDKLRDLQELDDQQVSEQFRLSQQLEDYRQFELEQQQQKVTFQEHEMIQKQHEKSHKSYLEQIKDFHTNERNQILLNHQNQQIEQQAQQIIQLHEILEDLKKKDKIEKQRLKNEKDSLTRELQVLQKKLASSTETLSQIQQQYQKLEITNYPQDIGQVVSISNNILQKHEIIKIVKVPKIESQSVLRIGKEINFRLRLKRIPLEYAVKRLLTKQIKRIGFTSLEYLIKKLRGDPFNVPEKADALLLSRFLAEDNSQNLVEVNLGVKCHYKVARSVFKSIVGQVTLYQNDEEEHKIWEKCSEDIAKYNAALKQYAEIYFTKKNQEVNFLVNWEQIKDAFTYASNEFDNEQIDYVLIRLFEDSNNINKLQFQKIFDIFHYKNWRNMDQRSKNSLIFKPDHKNDSTESEEEIDDISQASNPQSNLPSTRNANLNNYSNNFNYQKMDSNTDRNLYKYSSPQISSRR